MNRNDHPAVGTLPAITIAARDHARLQALADSAATSAPQVGRYLSRELERASVVDELALGADIVRIGSAALYQDSGEPTPRRVWLAWPQEADVARDRISVISLVGAALLGLRAGQSIEWPDPFGGVRRLTVLEVLPANPSGTRATTSTCA